MRDIVQAEAFWLAVNEGCNMFALHRRDRLAAGLLERFKAYDLDVGPIRPRWPQRVRTIVEIAGDARFDHEIDHLPVRERTITGQSNNSIRCKRLRRSHHPFKH